MKLIRKAINKASLEAVGAQKVDEINSNDKSLTEVSFTIKSFPDIKPALKIRDEVSKIKTTDGLLKFIKKYNLIDPLKFTFGYRAGLTEFTDFNPNFSEVKYYINNDNFVFYYEKLIMGREINSGNVLYSAYVIKIRISDGKINPD